MLKLPKRNNGFVSGTIHARPLSNQMNHAMQTQALSKQPATQTTYTDRGGNPHTGWIVGGQTYQDQAGTQRVPMGSTVNTAGGQYTLTPHGGMRSPQGAIAAYQQAAGGGTQAYRDAQAAQQRAIQASTQAALARIGQSEEQTRQNTVDANRQAYQSYVMASNPYGAGAQQRAALGLANSGLAESSQVALGSAYQGAMNQNQVSEQQILAELAVQRSVAQQSGDVATAEAAAQYANLIAQHGLQVANTILGAEMSAHDSAQSAMQWQDQLGLQQRGLEADEDQRGIDNARREQERQDGLAADRQSWAYQMFQRGVITPEVAEALGVSEDVLRAAYAAQMQPAARSAGGLAGGSGGGGGGYADDGGGYAPAWDIPAGQPAALTPLEQARLASQAGVLGGTGGTPQSNAFGFAMLGDPARAATQAAAEPQVTNQSGDTWINVPGYGRLSWAELERMVNEGSVIEVIEGNSVSYRKR